MLHLKHTKHSLIALLITLFSNSVSVAQTNKIDNKLNSNKMVVEYIRYKIDTANINAFVAAIKEASEIVKADPNYVNIELCQGEEEPNNFIWRIEWKSTEGHLNGFRKSAKFSEFFAIVKPYFNNIQEMKHYNKIF
jgi:quinol monooxygenase YgiN